MRAVVLTALIFGLAACAQQQAAGPGPYIDPHEACSRVSNNFEWYAACIRGHGAPVGFVQIVGNIAEQVGRGETTEQAAYDTATWYWRDRHKSEAEAAYRARLAAAARQAESDAIRRAQSLMLMQHGLFLLGQSRQPTTYAPAQPIGPTRCTAIDHGIITNIECW